MNPIAVSTPRTDRPQSAERQALTGSACPGLSTCEKLRGCNADDPLDVSLILKPDKATPEALRSLQNFARTNGLSVASFDPETRTVRLQGNVAGYQKAFGVQLQEYKAPQGRAFRGYEGTLSMPRSLAGSVDGVFGLSDRPVVRPLHVQADPRMGGGYMAPQVASMYNFPTGVDGTGQTIGILEFGGGYNQSDLQAYFQKAGVKAPNVSSVSIDGQTNTPGQDQNVDGEVALDIEIAGAVAPGANIVVYFAPDTEQGFIDAINTAAHDKTNNPKILSVSWGSPEDSQDDPPPTGWSTDGRSAVNNALHDAANLGVNAFIASGDDGSKGGANDGKSHTDYPACSPWAIAVGGTRLSSDGQGHRGNEVAWGDGLFGGASGGGVSNIFPVPDYQQGVSIPAPAQAGGGRGVPDVSGNADPTTGYDVIWDGQEGPVGGTSCTAPLYAGLAALLGQGVGQPLGFLNPFFYKNPGAFNDITSGSNGAYRAGPGWDPVTGLGSPDGTRLLAALKAQAGV